jgi:hypothetical protein
MSYFPLKRSIHAEFNENNICFLPYSVQNINIVIIVTIKIFLDFLQGEIKQYSACETYLNPTCLGPVFVFGFYWLN